MAQKTVFLPEIGEVTLSKRRGATNIRISINGAGRVRIGMPYWTPYAAGITFAKSKQEWIIKQLSSHSVYLLKEGDLIGKAHRLHFELNNSESISTRVNQNSVIVSSNYPFDHSSVQKKAYAACERALRSEAEKLLPQRVELLAKKYGYNYKEIRIRKLISRWGSCSSTKVLSLSYYLIQLPWQLIDYVLLHELTHTLHMNHSQRFWSDFQKNLPNAKLLQKEIKLYKPKVIPGSNFMRF
jgi:predicted metal-dependent hydrolase